MERAACTRCGTKVEGVAQELSDEVRVRYSIAILSLRSKGTQEEYLYTSSVCERGTRVSTNNKRKLRSN